MSKIKTNQMKLSNFEDVDNAIFEIAKIETWLSKKEGVMNMKIKQIRDKYDEETAPMITAAENLKRKITDFCERNKELFDEKRTKELKYGYVGFRSNPPSVVEFNQAWKKKSKLAFTKTLFNGPYVGARQHLNKRRILDDYESKLLAESRLESAGLRIEKGETFNLEIKWESLQP